MYQQIEMAAALEMMLSENFWRTQLCYMLWYYSGICLHWL